MNKKLFSVLFLGCLVLFTLRARASEWIRIDLNTKADSKKHFINLKQIEQNDGVITFREKYMYPDDSYILMKSSINCESKEFKILDISSHTAGGAIIKADFQLPEWTAITPYSERDEVKYIVCIDDRPVPSSKIADIKLFRKIMLGNAPQ